MKYPSHHQNVKGLPYMIKNMPSWDEILDKVRSIVVESAEPEGRLRDDLPLMAEQGLDSLDLIEVSFSLQEFFEFEFSDKNAIEELERALGDHSIIGEDGRLTDKGREMVLKRMPELENVSLPEDLTPLQLQQYFTVETFARLALEFYEAAPEIDPESGERVVADGFKVVTEDSGKVVKLPSGDELIDRWVEDTAAAARA
jgi:acyl carrier protein